MRPLLALGRAFWVVTRTGELLAFGGWNAKHPEDTEPALLESKEAGEACDLSPDHFFSRKGMSFLCSSSPC